MEWDAFCGSGFVGAWSSHFSLSDLDLLFYLEKAEGRYLNETIIHNESW